MMPINQLRCSNEHLLWIAAAQGACSAVGLVIDDGYAPTRFGASGRYASSAGSGADDNQIVALRHLRRCYWVVGVQEGFRVGSICIEGHRTEPYEQKTQQSPARGRSTSPQCVHS